MTRIVAGEWGGRRLRAPSGDGTRPTSDRVRESLFQSIGSMQGGLDGAHVLDLFAGSGALGLEAESRGAAAVDLVESDKRAASVVAHNVAELGSGAVLHRTTAERFVRAPVTRVWDVALLDPPYAMGTEAIQGLLVELSVALADDALVVVERSRRTPFVWPDGFEAVRDKTYGETTLWYGRRVRTPARSTP